MVARKFAISLAALFSLTLPSYVLADWDSSIWDEAVWDQAAALYEVRASATDGGLIDPAGVLRVSVNEVLVFTLVADEGFELSSVESSCGGSIDGSSFVTDPIVGDCSVHAAFGLITSPPTGTLSFEQYTINGLEYGGSVAALADIDGDTDLDLLVGTGRENKVYVNDGAYVPFIGQIPVNLATAASYPTASIAVDDVDSDGNVDLIVGDDGHPNKLFLSNGTMDPFSGVTSSRAGQDKGVYLETSYQTEDLFLADFDGNGALDLLEHTGSRAILFLNDGGSAPLAVTPNWEFPYGYGAAVGDVNNDGFIDVVAAGSLFLNSQGQDPFTLVNGIALPGEDGDLRMQLLDANADGNLDLLRGNHLFLNDGSETLFAESAASTFDETVGINRVFADLDGDDHLDLIAGSPQTILGRLPIKVFINNGTDAPYTGVSPIELGDTDSRVRGIAVGDLDSDGDADFVVVGDQDLIYLNQQIVLPPPPPAVYEINLSFGEGGQVSPSGSLQVLEGETQVFLISLNDNYEVRSVLGGCVASFDNTRIETVGVSADCDIEVTFGLISGTVPPSQPTISLSEASPTSISFAIDVADQGSDPIIDYTATCEIPPPPQKNATQNLQSQLIGELVSLGKSQVGTPASAGVYGLDLRLDLRDAEIGDRLDFPSSDGQIISLLIDQRDVTKFGNIRLRGSGGENSFDLMIAPHGAVIGEYFDGKTSVEIRPTPGGQRLYVGSEGGISSINDDFAIAIPPVSTLSKSGVLDPFGQGVISEDFYVVSLLIMVDQVIENSGNKYLFADYFVTAANTAYLDSGVRVVLSLLDVVLNQPSTSNQNQAGILEEITCGAAGCDYINGSTYNGAINSLRESYRADLVAQMVSYAEEPVGGGPICGIATLPFGELYNPDTFAADLRYRYSYSVVALGVQSTDQICPYVLLAHEIGHNMGLLHDAVQSPNFSPLVPGGRGFVLGDGLRGTVMSYPPAGIFTGYVNLFSDPDYFYDGWRLGTTAAPYPADSTNALNVAAPFYANIFSNTNAELIPESPELVSVSQRGTFADVFFNEVDAPVGTPVDANLERRLLYLADCGNNSAQLGYGSPITISGLARGQSHSCVVYALTDYAGSSASNTKSVFMEKLTYTIQASASAGGEISPAGSIEVKEGDSISFDLSPSQGYELSADVGGTCNGNLSGQSYNVDNVQADCSVVAKFKEIKSEYIVTPTVTVGGSVVPNSPQTVVEGEVVSFEMIPQDGYAIGPVGGTCGGAQVGSIYTTDIITSDCSVEVSFEESQPRDALITVNVVGQGSISPTLPITVPIGDSVTFVVNPDEDYRLAGVSGCNGQLTGQTYEIPAVTEDCMISARFSKFRWVIISEDSVITFNELPSDTAFECSVVARSEAGESAQTAIFRVQTTSETGDADSDGVPDAEDAFPNDASESIDTDRDGIGNNADTDDDGDGYSDAEEIREGTDPLDAKSQPADIGGLNILVLKAAIDAAKGINP